MTIGDEHPVDDGFCLGSLARAKQIERRFRNEEAQSEAEHRRDGRDRENVAPCVREFRERNEPCRHRHDQRSDGPEPLEHDEPATAASGRQELRHHGIVDRQGTSDCSTREETQEQKDAKAGCEDRQHAEDGIAGHGDDQHPPATNPIGKPTKTNRSDQHAEKEQGTGLECLRNRQAERRGDGGCRETNGKNLHGISRPDQAEDANQAVLIGSRAGAVERFVHRDRRHSVLP
ncbi:hypothetical protein D9M70_503240 [compost metagenome]